MNNRHNRIDSALFDVPEDTTFEAEQALYVIHMNWIGGLVVEMIADFFLNNLLLIQLHGRLQDGPRIWVEH